MNHSGRGRPLLPAPPKPQSVSSNSTSSRIVSKRASTRGKVACDPCRARKIACDCTHPVCHKCRKNGAECIYRPFQCRTALKRLLHERDHEFSLFLAQLKSLDDDEALHLIRRLHAAADVPSALAMAQGTLFSIERPLIHTLPLAKSGSELELAALDPVMYPLLLPINHESPLLSVNQVAADQAAVQHDSRLHELRIGYWTAVPIKDSEAAQLLSLYLERDHACIPLFDAGLFLDDLVNHKSTYCSALLVSSLLFVACQAHTANRTENPGMTLAFFNEAKRLWEAQKTTVTALNLVASQILSLGCLLQGNDKLSRHMASFGRTMAEKLGLLNNSADSPAALVFQKQSPSNIRFMSQIAWGTFVWFTLLVINYRDEPISLPPILPIPGETIDANSPSLPPYTGHTFPQLCTLFLIRHEIALASFSPGQASPEPVAMAFAQAIYHKLLSWSESLPRLLLREDYNQNHVILLHTRFLCTVLDLFRPFCPHVAPEEYMTPLEYHPPAIYAASLKQLKHVLHSYCLLQLPSHYSPFIGFSMTHVIAGMLNESRNTDWRTYLTIFFHCWTHLYSAYPLYGEMAQASLSMLLRHGWLSGHEAHELLSNLRQNGQHQVDAVDMRPETSFVIDWNQAVTDTESARIATVARDFSHLTMFDELTINDDLMIEPIKDA